MYCPPSSRNEMKDGNDADQRSANIDHRLHHVGPDDSRKASFECVDQGQQGDDGDGSYFAGPERDGDDNRDGVDAHSFRSGASQQEQSRGERSQSSAEAALDQLVSGIEITAEVVGQEHEADDDSAHEIPEDDLQELQVGVVGESGNTDDGQGAGFSRNDRERDRPPGNIPVGEEVVFQRALTFSELKPKQSYSREVRRDDQVIESTKAHALRSESVIAIRLAKMNLHYRGKH